MDALLLPPLARRRTLEGLREFAEKRRTARDREIEVKRKVDAAVAVALGAGISTAGVVQVVTQSYNRFMQVPCNVYTRQAAYGVVNAVEDPAVAHRAAGSPSEDDALQALTEAVKGALDAVHDHQTHRDVLARMMWECVEAGYGPTAVADASGYATATAFKYLGLRERWNRVRDALDDANLLEASRDGFPLLGVRNFGAGIVVCNVLEESDVQRRLREALAGVGERLGAGRRGDWIVIQPQESDTETA